MKKNIISMLFVFCMSFTCIQNSTFAFTSKADSILIKELSKMGIPLVVINTVDEEEPVCDTVDPPEGAWGAGIANATKVPAGMQIILKGDTLFDSGKYVKKESGLTIKIRGNNSGRNPKPSYKLKLQKKADLLLRGDKKYKDKDWVLLRNGASLVTPIGFWTSELIGQEWTPDHKIVNVWMNGTYRGLYILCEQVTVNQDCRINVDNNEGYVVEADPYWWTEDICFPSSLTVNALKFTYKYPDPEDLTEEWHNYVSNDVIANEAKITDGTYDEVYDCESFAKWLVSWELLGNADSAGGNMYLVKKDSSSKICMGPIWDFDHALKLQNDWIGLHYRWFYFHHMLQSHNDSFQKAFRQVWEDKGRIVTDSLITRLNTFVTSNEGKDYQRSLDIQEQCDIITDEWILRYKDLEGMYSYAVDFLSNRADWIDTHINEVSGVELNHADSDVPVFNIQGVKVGSKASLQSLAPGIYIVGGRKVVVSE